VVGSCPTDFNLTTILQSIPFFVNNKRVDFVKMGKKLYHSGGKTANFYDLPLVVLTATCAKFVDKSGLENFHRAGAFCLALQKSGRVRAPFQKRLSFGVKYDMIVVI